MASFASFSEMTQMTQLSKLTKLTTLSVIRFLFLPATSNLHSHTPTLTKI